MKISLSILFVTILVSIGFYFLIAPAVIYFLDFTNVRGAVVSLIENISAVFRIFGLFILLLNVLTFYLMRYFKSKQRTDLQKGFYYSAVYSFVLLIIYGLVWVVL